MQITLFEQDRLTLPKSIALSAESLNKYGAFYKHWAIAFSGGKDSTATVILIAHLIETGQIDPPETVTVLYADTRQELPPLHNAAMGILKTLAEKHGFDCRVVLPELDHRYFVYMLGRGVPPPSNVFRWCTPKLKVMSMERELEKLRQERGEKFLMITGVRIGESAARDQRISMSCTKDGGECGQGWFQQTTSGAVADTLAPIVHWRVCHVWDFLRFEAPMLGFETEAIAQVYGQHNADGEEPLKSRTGCFGCPLVQEDAALEVVCSQPQWSYLSPLKRLRPLYWELHKPQYRLRKPGGERRKDGKLTTKQNRLGPLTIETRLWVKDEILKIEQEVNEGAIACNAPLISLINQQELVRIDELIKARTFPDRWTGDEPRGDSEYNYYHKDGSIQTNLFAALEA